MCHVPSPTFHYGKGSMAWGAETMARVFPGGRSGKRAPPGEAPSFTEHWNMEDSGTSHLMSPCHLAVFMPQYELI
jgi:hypothetical protein